ncbi:MAG: hypothetical protein IT558_04380 [Alphaproteobacteria bacterium]|nr:hypothetical protein [Alphaproteobacteria bacterium]
MNEATEPKPDRPPVGNLTDFVIGDDPNDRLDIQVAVKHDGGVVMFHTHKFKKPVSWFEFDLATNRLDFILDNGDVRDVGMPLPQRISKYMQNTYQILMVWMDPKTGDAKEGDYVPVVIHRS